MSNSNPQIKLVTMSNATKKTVVNKNTTKKSANYAKKSSNPDAKKYYAQMANKDPVGYMKNSLEYIDKKYKKADGTYDRAFYKAPKDYYHNNNYTYKSTYKYEPTERGLIDRIFGVLGYNGIPQAIYNAIDDDEDTTILGGLAQGFKYMNPLEDDVSERKTMQDVFKEAGWDSETTGNKIGRGVIGFVGDVLLDPLSYIPYAGPISKVIKGVGLGVKGVSNLAKAERAATVAGKAAQATKSTSRTKNLTNLSYETALNVMKKQYPSMPQKAVERATLKTLDKYAGKVERVRGLDEGEGLTFGLGNLIPFANKIKVGDKTLDKFTKEIVSASTLRKIGNKTVAPYYNSLARQIRSTKVAGAFSNNNKLFRISKEMGDEEAFKRFALSEAEKGMSKANRNFVALRQADELERNLADVGDEYTDIDFITDHDEGLYDKVYEYRTLKNKAAAKAAEASNLAAAEKEATLKNIQKAQQDLDSVYNKTKEKYNEIFAKYEGSDLKNLNSAIKSKKEEIDSLVNSAKRGTKDIKLNAAPAFKSQVTKAVDSPDEAFKNSSSIAENAAANTHEISRKIGEYQIEDYEKKLHLTQKYFREAYTMMGKGISKMDAGESQRFFSLFSDLEDLSPTGKINWGELLNEYDNNALRMRVRNKLSINARSSEPVSWKNAFLSLDENTQRAVINGYKDKLIDSVFDKLKYGNDRHFNIGVRVNLNTIADLMKQENVSPFTTRVLRSVYDLTNYTGMYMKLRSFSSTFTDLLQKHLFSSTGGKIGDNIYNIISKVEKNQFLSDSEVESLYNELKGLYNSKGLSSEDLSKLDKLSSEFTDLKAQRQQYLKDADKFQKYVKSNQVNEDIERLTLKLDELEQAAGKSVLDDMKAMSSPDDEIMQKLGVNSEDFERIRYLDEHEDILAMHEKYYDNTAKWARRENAVGALSKEQIKEMGRKYVPREISEEAQEILKRNDYDMHSDSGKFNPSEHGNKKTFDESRKFKTMREGEKWFNQQKRNLIESGEDIDVSSKLYKYNVTETYLTRAIASNNLVLSKEINNFVKNELCTPFKGEITSDRVVMSYLDTYQALSNYYAKYADKLSKAYPNPKKFIEAVVDEAGMDTSLYKTPKNPEKLLKKISDTKQNVANSLFSPNYSYFDVTQDQIDVFKKYTLKGEKLEAYNMDNMTFDLINKFTKVQTQLLQSDFTRLYDKFLSQWKLWNTIVSPGFHFQNAVSNAFQSFLSVGSAAFNPKKIKKAVDVVRLKDPKQTMTLAGVKYTYKELNSAVEYYKVADNTFMNYEMSAKEAAKMAGKGSNIASKALGKIYEFGGIAGSNIETVGRVNLFLALVDEGKSFERAAEDVDKFLFDYSDLTNFEKNTMRRILPFYTFMRKNIPLMLEQMLEKPVIFSELDKAKTNIEKASSNYIGENDRNEYRQDYIQLPFEINGKQWGISDQLPYTQFDKLFSMKESDALPVTLPRQLMGQTSPALKIPAELLTGETMYNGFPIKNEDDSPEWSAAKYVLNNLGTYPSMIARRDNKNGTDEKIAYVISALSGFPVQVITDQSVPPWERADWKDKE